MYFFSLIDACRDYLTWLTRHDKLSPSGHVARQLIKMFPAASDGDAAKTLI